MANVLTSARGLGRVVSVLPSAARTATPDTVEILEFDSGVSGLALVVDSTAVTATGTLTVKIQGVDPVSGKTWDILTSTAISSVATTVLRVHPSIAAVANSAAADVLPPRVRILVTHGNAVSMTYSVTALFTS